MGTVFFTGFPGFLGTELLPRILARSAERRAACLVQPKYAELARQRARELQDADPKLEGRIDILEGDISRPGLGLSQAAAPRDGIVEIYHLAAIYDLSVGRESAMRVNVEGTRNVLDFACECPALERFQYVSTCYVSGTHPGLFSEDDLDRGQRFHNFYEETKFLAEVEVQKRMREGLPVTIYRPAVVVGDSRTGTTQKYDGPYSIIRFLLRQPRIAVLPAVGNPSQAEVNVVPRDFVVEAIAFLSGTPGSKNRVYHLADPKPLTVEQMTRELARATGRSLIRVPVPLGAAKLLLAHVPGMRSLIGIPANTLDYFVHPGHYVTTATQAALQAGGVRCPRFPEYAGRLVEFVIAHPEVGSRAMA
jgi:thioester reductase-like protein